MRDCDYDRVHPSNQCGLPHRFTLTPQRMRMITHSFRETLDAGLDKPEQVVVSAHRDKTLLGCSPECPR